MYNNNNNNLNTPNQTNFNFFRLTHPELLNLQEDKLPVKNKNKTRRISDDRVD